MSMDCQTAQRLFDDLSGNHLEKAVAQRVHQHLADCTDCRVLQQRTARLQRLLALKRYEQPSPHYTANIVANFHRRLAEEERRGSVWHQLMTRLGLESFAIPRVNWAGACALFLVAGMCWVGLRNSSEALVQPHASQIPSLASQSVVTLIPVSAGAISSAPGSLLDDEALSLSDAGGDLIELVAAGRTQPSQPRYVLDRIAITPASYETARADF